ncbi:hypothetical protein RR46_10415 [Papilio xuthus]|uniref:Uncharacterized protein n=1 Tax=Papilio xuthus TaxID=66420 RepID=A0A194Q0I9_PAPXU|nr:hypothetical protein RR46_10415 [Papilio xuthus]
MVTKHCPDLNKKVSGVASRPCVPARRVGSACTGGGARAGQHNLSTSQVELAILASRVCAGGLVSAPRAPYATRSVEDTTKIGNAEAKPVTRNRPRSVSHLEDVKLKSRKGIERSKPVSRLERPARPERPARSSRAPQPPPDHQVEPEPIHRKPQTKTSNVILEIVKRSVTPKQVRKGVTNEGASLLPPSLKPRVPEKTKLRLNKLINNNNDWSNANVHQITAPPVPTSDQGGCLRAAASRSVRGGGEQMWPACLPVTTQHL